MNSQVNLSVVPTAADHVPQLCSLLNEIIRIGGTTAYQFELSEASFEESFLLHPDRICCFTAMTAEGEAVGFQSLEHRDRIPADWGDIATFAKVGATARGIGSSLFRKTLQLAVEQELVAINAVIRADNSGGLRYYDKIGFVTYDTSKAVPLADGTLVDRIWKRYDIAK